MLTKYALSAAALLQLASAQALAGANTDKVDSKTWESVIDSANYTNTQTFEGRDVSSSYPASSQEGWELRLALKDGVDAGGDGKVTAGAISLAGPSSDFDESWHLCLHVFPVRIASAGGEWSTEYDGTCSGSVAGECLDDLKKRAMSNYDKDCKSWELTASCLRDINNDVTFSKAVSVTSDNHQDFIGNDTSFYRETLGSDALQAILEPRAVVSVWGPSKDSDDEPTVAVTCLRPNKVEEGSTDPAKPAEGAASSLAVSAGWAVAAAAVAFQLL